MTWWIFPCACWTSGLLLTSLSNLWHLWDINVQILWCTANISLYESWACFSSVTGQKAAYQVCWLILLRCSKVGNEWLWVRHELSTISLCSKVSIELHVLSVKTTSRGSRGGKKETSSKSFLRLLAALSDTLFKTFLSSQLTSRVSSFPSLYTMEF